MGTKKKIVVAKKQKIVIKPIGVNKGKVVPKSSPAKNPKKIVKPLVKKDNKAKGKKKIKNQPNAFAYDLYAKNLTRDPYQFFLEDGNHIRKNISDITFPKLFIPRTPFSSKTITVTINNYSNEKKSVPIFSFYKPIPERVEVTVGESSYDFVMKTILSDPMYVTSLRLTSLNMNQSIKVVNIEKKTRHGEIASYPLLPLSYFSPYQYQTGIIELCPYNIRIDVGVSLTFDVLPHTVLVVTFFVGDFKSNEEFLAYINKHSAPVTRVGNQVPILIENTSDKKQKINLFDVNKSEWNPLINKNIKIERLFDSSYQETLQEFQDFGFFDRINKLRIFTSNINQLTSPIHSKYLGKKGLNPKIDTHQFQSHLVDENFKFKAGCPLTITIEPNTQVLYCFYEEISVIEQAKRKFYASHGRELEKLGLSLVENKPTVKQK